MAVQVGVGLGAVSMVHMGMSFRAVHVVFMEMDVFMFGRIRSIRLP